MSLRDLKNKSPVYNWDKVQDMNMTDLTTFDSPGLDSMGLSNLINFESDLGDRRSVGTSRYNSENAGGLSFSDTVKYGKNQYKGSRFDDAGSYVGSSLGNSLISENFNFDLNQSFNEKINSLKKFGDIYNDNQTVKDTKLTGLGGSDKLNLSTAAYNSGFRKSIFKGGNNNVGTEPYYITKVRPSEGANFLTQFDKAGRDLVRITKFLGSPAGLSHIFKQNLLGLNGRPNPSGLDPLNISRTAGFPKPLTGPTGNIAKLAASAAAALMKFLPLTQKYKPLYSPLSAMANATAGAIGVQGSRLVRFERDWPLGGKGLLLNIGGTNQSYRDYMNETNVSSFTFDDKLYYRGQASHRRQNLESDLTSTTNVNESMNSQINRGETRGFGDFMTLMEFNIPDAPGSIPTGKTLKDAHPNDAINIESERHGMPFYFFDLRDSTYIIFRGYIEGLTENVAPEWTPEKYVGRSEPVYTYSGAERDISFSLKLFAHTKYELAAIYKKMNRLTSLCYPQYQQDNVLKGTSVALSEKFTRMKPPLTKFRMGELYGGSGTTDVSDEKYINEDLTGFIKSLSYSVPEEAVWEIKKGMRVPKYVTVAITYQVIHSEVPNIKTKFYGYTGS